MKKVRCAWCGVDPQYIEYHDQEWGKPVRDDTILFEFLVLETFQAGLSWITILRKRENFRKAFDNFDYNKIAHYEQTKIEALLQNSGIVRHRLKILAAISNAQAFIKIQTEFGSFSNYLWQFVHNEPIVNRFETHEQVPATSALSDIISKDLKKHDFKFVGSTVIYAFLQAIGVINDHVVDCFRFEEVLED